MIQIRIKDKTGYSYEQYFSDKEVNKRVQQLEEKGINTEKDVTITRYAD